MIRKSAYAVIVAGGSGTRMGSSVPKQFLEILGKPVLSYTLEAFLNCGVDCSIILVVPVEHELLAKSIVATTSKPSNVQVVHGGATRFESMKNGLSFVPDDAIVWVHDAVRCLVDQSLIIRCYEQAVKFGSAIPAVAATDSIRVLDGNKHKVIDRNTIQLIQTPQTFQAVILKQACQQEFNPSFTDEATVVEASGKEVFLCDGSYDNIKITRPADLVIAEQILNQRLK